MKHRRKSYVRMMILYLLAILLLLFAWWASGEIYKPKPTPLPTDVIVLPPKATATDIVYPVYTKSPTPVTIATQTSTFIPTATQAPASTPTHTYIPPTATPYYHVPNFAIIEHDCIIMSGNMRKSYMTFVYSCSPFILYNYVYDVALPYRIPRGTIISPTIVPLTPGPGVTPKP